MPLETAITNAAESPEFYTPTRAPRLSFNLAAPRGFGDRDNTWAWSMIWWRGKLYVGTNRSWLCCERAAMNIALPGVIKALLAKYPPDDPEVECAPDPLDLKLQAEIWTWTPETDAWERVYQAPKDAIVKGKPDRHVSREVGYRYMTIFPETDGTEALYVASVTPKFVYWLYGRGNHYFPPPGLLRTTDGVNFAHVPQDPGTFMGDLPKNTLRTMVVYKDKLFLTHGPVRGFGFLMVSPDPKAGNDSFQYALPETVKVFDMIPYNGYLYVGVRDEEGGYGVVKTDASGQPPYQFTTIVSKGGYLAKPSTNVISMRIFKDRLYVGTDRPAEIIRINPDDSWDLVVGTPRQTPDGWKYPLSGHDAGFNNYLNGHIWWMREYEGRLYVGTMNMGMTLRTLPQAEGIIKPGSGVHLFETEDGCHFAPVTTDGFGRISNFGVRTMVDTPHGLFVGTTNNWTGLEIWRGAPTVEPTATPPEELEVEMKGEQPLLSWDAAAGAKQYLVWRAEFYDRRGTIERNKVLSGLLKVVRNFLRSNRRMYLPPLPDKVWVPERYEAIGATAETFFVDDKASAGQHHMYYVVAEYEGGQRSVASNIVTAPSFTPSATFDSLRQLIQRHAPRLDDSDAVREGVNAAHSAVKMGDAARAIGTLKNLYGKLAQADVAAWAASDVQVALRKLVRRIMLVQAGLIPAEALDKGQAETN